MNRFELKLAELFAAMELRGYDAYFKGSRDKAVEVLQRHLDTMSRYIDAVYAQEAAEAAMTQAGGQAARDEMERLNGARTAAHNAAMGSLNVVNRVFDGYGLDPFVVVDPADNRSDIGEKIADYVGAMFLGRDGLSRTEAAKLAHDCGVTHAKRSAALAETLAGLP